VQLRAAGCIFAQLAGAMCVFGNCGRVERVCSLASDGATARPLDAVLLPLVTPEKLHVLEIQLQKLYADVAQLTWRLAQHCFTRDFLRYTSLLVKLRVGICSQKWFFFYLNLIEVQMKKEQIMFM
jgi:hypothetical protein